jgi:hypothetical protein
LGFFFLAAVQAVRSDDDALPVPAVSSDKKAARATSMKKKRVLPMFFFRRMSAGGIADIRHGRDAAVFRARRRDAAGTATKKKLREGVDTLKNRD